MKSSLVMRMNSILEVISSEQTIAISGHIKPDGDCFGSTMALYCYLKQEFPERQIDLYLEMIPNSFRFFSLTEEIKTKDRVGDTISEMPPYDLFISLDCGSPDRLGFVEGVFEKAKRTINIDHHISNVNFGDINHVVPYASSTCEVIYDLLEESRLTNEMAEALYLGIVHDTGVFKYSNTSRHTMEIAGKLMERGIPFSKIIDETFYEKSYTQNLLIGRCMLDSTLFFDGQVIATHLEQATIEEYGANPQELEGIVDQLRVTRGIDVAIFIHEMATGEYKVSLRANNRDVVDVSKIAVHFGGGGHIKAAGCTMKGTYKEIYDKLLEQIKEQLQ